MKKKKYTDEEIIQAYIDAECSKKPAARKLGVPETSFRRWIGDIESKQGKIKPNIWKESKSRNVWIIEFDESRIRTVDDAIKKAGVDTAIWEVDKVEVSGWDVTMKLSDGKKDKPFRSQNQRIKVTLKRAVSEELETGVNNLLKRLEEKSPIAKPIKYKINKTKTNRELEICIMDPHYGMTCHKPASDAEWSPDLCNKMVQQSLEELILLAERHGPFSRIILPTGNDFFHIDNVFHTTTSGTTQPEAESYLSTFITGEQLMITIIDRLKQIAPVKVLSIPGNHDRATSFMLGRVLKAYYTNDENVEVDASSSPYKFHEFGINLIGYEHGHSVPSIRLAALMANECPQGWARTQYREWHIGDQHRKGSAKPSTFEEQGVSVEYLPSITAPNEWHRLKSYNWQKRGTMAFVWDKKAGPIARLQVNVDRYLNKLMGK